MKTKIKPRRMWANHYSHGRLGIYRTKRAAAYFRGLFDGESIPVAVIPLDDVDSLVKKAQEAYVRADLSPETGLLSECIAAALTAIGVLPKRKGGRK